MTETDRRALAFVNYWPGKRAGTEYDVILKWGDRVGGEAEALLLREVEEEESYDDGKWDR